eukprot:38228-Chlamydomonas_euryale.AAC.2
MYPCAWPGVCMPLDVSMRMEVGRMCTPCGRRAKAGMPMRMPMRMPTQLPMSPPMHMCMRMPMRTCMRPRRAEL